MREPRYSILSDINDGIDRAKQGKLALYWLCTGSGTLNTNTAAKK